MLVKHKIGNTEQLKDLFSSDARNQTVSLLPLFQLTPLFKTNYYLIIFLFSFATYLDGTNLSLSNCWLRNKIQQSFRELIFWQVKLSVNSGNFSTTAIKMNLNGYSLIGMRFQRFLVCVFDHVSLL